MSELGLLLPVLLFAGSFGGLIFIFYGGRAGPGHPWYIGVLIYLCFLGTACSGGVMLFRIFEWWG
jgi:hypothetical protein